MAKTGSIILTVLIIMTALVVIMHSLLRATHYCMLLAQEREKAVKVLIFNPIFLGYTKNIDTIAKYN